MNQPSDSQWPRLLMVDSSVANPAKAPAPPAGDEQVRGPNGSDLHPSGNSLRPDGNGSGVSELQR